MTMTRLPLWIIALTLLLPMACRAQQLPGAAAFDAGPGAEGHGWVIVGPDDSPVLVHIPPRGSIDIGDRTMSTQSGAVRVAASLSAMPEAIAASERSVYLVFSRSGTRRLVLRASVSPSPVGNMWDLNQRERLDALPPIEAPGVLVDLVAGKGGLMALLSDGHPRVPSLLMLRGDHWTPIEMPIPAATARLVSSADGYELLTGSTGDLVHWRTRIGAGHEAPVVKWERLVPPIPTNAVISDPGPLWSIGGAVVFAARTSTSLEIRALRPSGPLTIAAIPGVANRFAMAPLPGSGRVVLVWKPSDAAKPESGAKQAGAADNRYAVLEVSTFTGRVLYAGPPAEAWPFSLLEFRLLALLLVAIAVGVLLFVLRPDTGDGVVLLPKGTALAEPFRRAIAGAFDLVAAWLIVSPAMGVTVESLIFPVLGAKMVPALIAVLAVGCLHCTIGEWLVGRSIGKVIAGCRVVRVGRTEQPEPGNLPPSPPRLAEALVRNLIRWGIPPLGIAALASAGGRHRGDVAASTAVVVLVEPDEEPY